MNATEKTEYQMTLFDLDSWCGKMSPEHSVQTKAKTSKPSSRKSSGLSNRKRPLCLCLTGGGGTNQDASMMKWEDGLLLGDYMTHSFGEYPNEENVSRLSQILQEDAPAKYYLSARACAGILNRAERRGKALPEILKTALMNQVEYSNPKHKGGVRDRQPRQQSREGRVDSMEQKRNAFSDTGSDIVCLEGNGIRPSHNGNGFTASETMYTLNSTEMHGIAYGIHKP